MMKSSKSFQHLKWKMVRLSFIIIFAMLSASGSKSNVLVIDHTIMEFYYNSGNWSIELFFDYDVGNGNLENMRISGLYDTARFLPREYECYVPLVVTQADFESPLYINPEDDWLYIEILIENDWFRVDEFGLNFGEMSNPDDTWVSPPVGDESVAWQLLYCYIPPWGWGFNYWWTVKELPSTMGFDPYEVSKRATFSGYVLDKYENPIPGLKLNYFPPEIESSSPPLPLIYTDSSGHYYTDEMFCRKYHIEFLFNEDEIGDTTIFIEPDSANYFIFKLDTLLNGISEHYPLLSGLTIYNSPNPASNQTNFVVESKNPGPNYKGVIKIYNEAGYIMDIIPLEISGKKQLLTYNFTDKSLAAGLYFYSLEIGRAKMASGKMMISR
jgi:hypothetical protein